MQRLLLCSLTLASLLTGAGCQSVSSSKAQTYEVLTASIDAGRDVDAARLRTAFFAREEAAEELRKIIELEREALALMVDEPLRMGPIGNAILEINYTSLTGHLALARFYEHLDSTASLAVHRSWLEKLQAMIEATPGTAEAPHKVYSASEAEAYLRSRDLEQVGSMYHSRTAFPFMLLTAVRPPDDARLRNIFFDLSDAYRAAEAGVEASVADREFSPGVLIGYLAQQGDTAAQAFIGTYMASEDRIDEAIEWLKASTRRGNLISNLTLARAYWRKAQATEGEERAEFRQLMLDNYTQGIAAGSDEAMFALGSIYLAGEFGKDNRPTGVALLEQAVALQNPSAALLLAHMYYRGEVVTESLDSAEEYFHSAAATGSRRARMQYARFLFDPNNKRTFKDEARVWLAELADNDDSEAMLLLGNLYAKGIGVSQNLRKAFNWFKSAVSASDNNANIVNEVAWTLTVTNLPKLRKEAYALRIMDRMMNADEKARKNPAYLDTWAAAHAANGEFGEAVQLQELALSLAKEQQQIDDLSELESHLKLFNEQGTVTDPVP